MANRNLIDRALEVIAPVHAARRQVARAQLGLMQGIEPQSSYRGAIANRASTPWSTSTSYRGGTTSERQQLGHIRDRARASYRENTIARSLLNTETDNVVAGGFSLQMLSKDKAFNDEAEARFPEWLEVADITGKMCASELWRCSWRESRKDGDGGFILAKTADAQPRLQWISGDLIRNPDGGYDPKAMFHGVRCDRTGRPIEFNVRDVDENGRDITTAFAARDFVYIAHLDEPSAVRGVSVYNPIFNQLDQFEKYVDSVTKAAILATIFGLIHKVNKPGQTVGALPTLVNSQGLDQKAVTLEQGMLRVEGTAESTYQVDAKQPMTQTPDFMRALFRVICLAFDMPLEIGHKDLSQVNFSGGRIGLIAYYRSSRVKQELLKSKCWNRIVYWWLSVERQRQQLGYPNTFKTPFPADYGQFELHGHEWDYNDPVTEAQADLLEISMGLQSFQGAAARRARDFGAIQELNEQARKMMQGKGLPIVLSSLTRDPMPSPAATPPATAQGTINE